MKQLYDIPKEREAIRPPEELDMQTVEMERWLPFKFLTSLLRFGSGWFANHALQRTPRRALGLFDNVWPAPRPAGAESLSLGR
jgi:hypothetical protein